MSLARDDAGYLSAIDALETSFVKTGTIERKESPEKIDSGGENSASEINDVFEKNSNTDNQRTEKLQEEYNELEIKNKDLEKINSNLEQIDKIINNKEKQKEEKVEEPRDPESNKKREEAIAKIQDLRTKVTEKQSEIAEMQREIQQKVSSLVELQIGENVDSSEFEPVSVGYAESGSNKAEELKQSVINEIKENPEAVRKLQIKHINRDLLLAMLSLHG